MKTLWEYKKLFKEKWLEISEEEIQKIIDRIDEIWNLLFTKYLDKNGK
jgi:hypothetical protein